MEMGPDVSPEALPPVAWWKRRHVLPLAIVGGVGLVCVLALASRYGFRAAPQGEERTGDTTASSSVAGLQSATSFDLPYTAPDITIAQGLAAPFALSEVSNVQDIKDAYGISLTQSELARLERDKFIVLNVLDTTLVRDMGNDRKGIEVGDYGRELVSLYGRLVGSPDPRYRKQANSIFFTADSAMHLFSILSVELMKEAEHAYLIPKLKELTATLYKDAAARVAATTGDDQATWRVARNYLAVPYALQSTSLLSLSPGAYASVDDQTLSFEEYRQAFVDKDAVADTYEHAAQFVQGLTLDTASEDAVLADLKLVYDAPAKADSHILGGTGGGQINLPVPFSQFTVRGSYTHSSERRQYFRTMQWYQQLALLLNDDAATRVALLLGELVDARPALRTQYDTVNALLAQLVGPGDDLDVGDYADAVHALGDKRTNLEELRAFLKAHKPAPRIRDTTETYTMRFFSQKFIPDSYWTSKLTQGDEAPTVEGMQLPVTASSLEVMTLLGSTYARDSLPMTSFYTEYKKPIDIRLGELSAEAGAWGGDYWRSTQVTGILWTIQGLFSWYTAHRASLPAFMRAPLWDAKTLMTGSAFWTEMRHTNILYAKQSGAEGAGGDEDTCVSVPPPAKGYVEPQPEVYARLLYAAQSLRSVYHGFELPNLDKLDAFISYVEKLQEYTNLELANATLTETTVSTTTTMWDTTPCAATVVVDTPESMRWEELRTELVRRMVQALPTPVDSSVVPIVEKRAAVVADIHTAYGDTYLEEGTGVPRVILVAVKDANGPRLTIGFTYSQYELETHERLTDEAWQDHFYTDNFDDYNIHYKPKEAWPEPPPWYRELLGGR